MCQGFFTKDLFNSLLSFGSVKWTSFLRKSVYMKPIFPFSGGAADSVRCLPTTVAVRIRGGLSSPDRSQAGSAGQGAEACTGLWHHWERFCPFGGHGGGRQVSLRGVIEKREDLKNWVGEQFNGSSKSVLKALRCLSGQKWFEFNKLTYSQRCCVICFCFVLLVKILDLSNEFQYRLGDTFHLNWSIGCLTLRLSSR